jgi:hypothetical protein
VPTTSHALLVGDFTDRERDELNQAVVRGQASAVFCASVQKALLRMRSGQDLPMCVVIDGGLNVRQLVDAVRDGAESFAVPVLVLLSRPSVREWREAHLAGADDALCVEDAGGLTRRLANLSLKRTDGRPAATLGRAIIASRDGASRRRLGRTLRQVGFDVVYASDLEEATSSSRSEGAGAMPAFVVSTEPPSSTSGVTRSSATSDVGTIGEVPVLFLQPEQRHADSQSGDQVADITGRLLFFADELGKSAFKDRRASARKLYSTICCFRDGGLVQPTYGVTHNISREGLYIRSLDPPIANGTVWIELCPPASESAVLVRARVMWRRLPGAERGVLPPGFGLQLEPQRCAAADLQEFAKGYQTLLE